MVRAQLFGVDPSDGLTLCLATAGIAAVALLSGYLPARRATGIDPMQAPHWEQEFHRGDAERKVF